MMERNVTAVYIGGTDDMLKAVYGMDAITLNRGETHPATCHSQYWPGSIPNVCSDIYRHINM